MEKGLYVARVTDEGTKGAFADETVLADAETRKIFEERDRRVQERKVQEKVQAAKVSCEMGVAGDTMGWARKRKLVCIGRAALYGTIGVAAFACQRLGLMDWVVAFPVDVAMAMLAGYQVGRMGRSR